MPTTARWPSGARRRAIARVESEEVLTDFGERRTDPEPAARSAAASATEGDPTAKRDLQAGGQLLDGRLTEFPVDRRDQADRTDVQPARYELGPRELPQTLRICPGARAGADHERPGTQTDLPWFWFAAIPVGDDHPGWTPVGEVPDRRGKGPAFESLVDQQRGRLAVEPRSGDPGYIAVGGEPRKGVESREVGPVGTRGDDGYRTEDRGDFTGQPVRPGSVATAQRDDEGPRVVHAEHGGVGLFAV
jgi:hypothetical protein